MQPRGVRLKQKLAWFPGRLLRELRHEHIVTLLDVVEETT